MPLPVFYFAIPIILLLRNWIFCDPFTCLIFFCVDLQHGLIDKFIHKLTISFGNLQPQIRWNIIQLQSVPVHHCLYTHSIMRNHACAFIMVSSPLLLFHRVSCRSFILSHSCPPFNEIRLAWRSSCSRIMWSFIMILRNVVSS